MTTDFKDYIHRVGRTEGEAISLVNQYEVERYIAIEKLIGNTTLVL